ncbi:hypothetical protein BDW22DRAFT_1355934 [Trametopsis cervina]|nr:hypothetical protein BDW22DRAFT_1355934 [Trametopsis cervina]
MLSLARRPTTRLVLQKAYSTETAAQSTSHVRKDGAIRRAIAAHPNQLFIRCRDDHVHTMPEFLAILRAVEREFGRFKDYELNRDPYDKERMSKWFRVRLEDSEGYERVPEEGLLIDVAIPAATEPSPGGFGILDVQDLLHSQDKVTDSDIQAHASQPAELSPTEIRHVELRVERSVYRSAEKAEFIISRGRREAIGQAIASWGGFYDAPATSSVLDEHNAPSRMTALKSKYRPPTVASRREVESKTDEQADMPEELQVQEPEPDVISTDPVQDITTLSESAAHSTSSPTPATTTPLPAAAGVASAQMSARERQRQRLLEAARRNIRNPLPESVIPQKPEEPKPTQEDLEDKQREQKEQRRAIRERLWRLMAGKWPI